MKKYIFYSLLSSFLFPIVAVYPLSIISLLLYKAPSGLSDYYLRYFYSLKFGLISWVLSGVIVGFAIYKIRESYYSKRNLPVPSFGFMGIVCSILFQLAVGFIIKHLELLLNI
ncbi:hypothetical protein EB001_16555 [bacterium]|nr:hypothetical protein [bacterium]